MVNTKCNLIPIRVCRYMIRKVSVWLNPSPFGSGKARWDADLYHEDGRIERLTDINEEQILKIVGSLRIGSD